MAKTKKFQVKLEKLKLHGFGKENETISIEIKWKGPQKQYSLLSVPFYPKSKSKSKSKSPLQTNRTAPQHVLDQHQKSIHWNDQFDTVCHFHFSDHNSLPVWDAKFYVLLEECTKSKSKSKSLVLGKASLNLAEMISAMEMKMERNVPITLKDAAGLHQATISVVVNFVELRDEPDPTGIGQDATRNDKEGILKAFKDLTSFKKKNRDKAKGSVSSDGENRALGDRTTEKKRRLSLSFRHSKGKVEPWSGKTGAAVNDGSAVDRQEDDNEPSVSPASPVLTNSQTEKAETRDFSSEKDGQNKEETTEGRWETREIVSRDGKAKLKTQVFFGSLDQRSEQAGGESACTPIVAVITHWLHSNNGALPTQPELDSLIMEGSSEWQKLCSNDDYSNSFPNKHFDLETVMEADIRPITVSPEHSFVGFFSPEKFNCLTEAMSFEQIWKEVNNTETSPNSEPRIYIVSWNDHFFALKMEEDTCYIVDSLGERLFEGCHQAYILKFDSSSLVFENKEKEEDGELVCKGKECCREFFERFLAAITIEELEEEQKKLSGTNFIPHQRLQIDFHFSSPVASSSSTSPCSSYSNQDSA